MTEGDTAPVSETVAAPAPVEAPASQPDTEVVDVPR
jgi:hypothetical protein